MIKNSNSKHVIRWVLVSGVLGFVFLYFKLSLTDYGFKGSIQRAIPKKWSGVYKEYYANGTLKAETLYRFGRENGIQKEYYEDGNLSIVKEYQDGKAKISRQYYPSGELMVETSYDKDGYAHGIAKGYYKDGKLKDETIYAKRKWVLTKEYYKDGKLKLEESSENRWRKEYDEQGKLINEGKL